MLGCFDGRPYSYAEMTDDVKAIWQQLHKDLSAASYPTLFDPYTQRGFELDHMSIIDWIKAVRARRHLVAARTAARRRYNIEYGAEASEQSALNMLYLIGYTGQGQLRIFGASNEKYHVRGGNDQIPLAIAARLPGQIKTGQELIAIKQTPAGRYEADLPEGLGATTVTADKAVLALPFSILRVGQLLEGGLRAAQDDGDPRAGHGHELEAPPQFSTRHWVSLGSNGETYADTGYQNTWEVSRAQPGTAGILVDYTGGKIGASFGTRHAHRPREAVPGADRAGPAGHHQATGTARRRSTTGRDTRGRRARTRTGRSASTRSSPASSASSRETAISAASTRRSTFRAT